MNEFFPLGKGVTVTRAHDDWLLIMLDRTTKDKFINKDKKLIILSHKMHLTTRPLYQAWSLAGEYECNPGVKHIKQFVLVLGRVKSQGTYLLNATLSLTLDCCTVFRVARTTGGQVSARTNIFTLEGEFKVYPLQGNFEIWSQYFLKIGI